MPAKKYFTEEDKRQAALRHQAKFRENNRQKIRDGRIKSYHENPDREKSYHKTAYEKRVMDMSSLKKRLGCLVCGLHDIRVLEFHHRNPEDKSFSIGNSSTHSWQRVLDEILKCDLLCSNCHSIAEWERRHLGV